MSKPSFTLKRGDKPALAEADRDRLQGVSEAAAVFAAQADPDNPPLDAERLRRMQIAREIRRVREGTGLSQSQFAARFRIGLGRLRDFEQARSEPDLIVRVFFQLVRDDPARAEMLIREVVAADGAA